MGVPECGHGVATSIRKVWVSLADEFDNTVSIASLYSQAILAPSVQHPGYYSDSSASETMASSTRRTLTLVLAFLAWASLPRMAMANSLHMAKLCPEQHCDDLKYPLIDYQDGKCICRTHPCWSHDGYKHECQDEEYPFLHTVYGEDGILECKCAKFAHYDSPYITKDLCPGKQCIDPDYPVLDVEEDGTTCICRSHPCWNARGQKHECPNIKHPILKYREDKEGNPICKCGALMHEPEAKGEL
eukprot:1035040-Amphidinium_carterae.1